MSRRIASPFGQTCLPCRAGGFSYIEALVATFLVAIALVPALESLHSGIQAGSIYSANSEHYQRLDAKIEEILASPFSELEQAADTAGGPTFVIDSYSDAPGTDGRRLVYLARYDGDNADADGDPFTGVDAGLLWVKVQIEGSPAVLESLTAR